MLKTSVLSRLSVILLTTVVFLLTGCGAKPVQNVKIEAEANQIIDVLGENGIKATKNEVGEGERKSFQISVNSDEEVATAIQVMEDHCLGRPDPPEPEGGAVITSIEVERAREQRRMKMGIESLLRKLPGVTCVDVTFVPPQDRSLAINPYPSTASVVINYKTPAFSQTKEEVAGLVARSIPDLKPENVTVVIAQKPLRPLPDNRVAYNFTRIALVSGIGLATILTFIGVVFVLRKKRKNEVGEDEETEELVQEETPKQTSLLNDNYDYDDDDDDENLP